MDTITQAALGAAIAVAGWRDLGLRGVFFGVTCGLLPDADVVLGWGADAEWDRLLTHQPLAVGLAPGGPTRGRAGALEVGG